MARYSGDLLTGGTASADDVTNGAAAAACDDNPATYWETANSAFPHYWKYDLGAGIFKRVGQLTLLSEVINTHIAIKDFTLQGSIDNAAWSVAYTGQMADNTNVQTFQFLNGGYYRYYKVNVTSSWDSEYGYCLIKEVEMMEDLNKAGGFSGGQPWIFMKDMWEKHNKLLKPKLILPKDLGFSY